MKSVNIGELKNRLSHYLRIVRRGESVLVRDRDRIVARIEPAGRPANEEERLAELEARGILRPGIPGPSGPLLDRRPRIRTNAVEALLAERDEGP